MPSHSTTGTSPSPEDPFSVPRRTKHPPVTRAAAAVIVAIFTSSLLFTTLFVCRANPTARALSVLPTSSQEVSEPQSLSIEDRSAIRRKAQRSPKSWLRYLRTASPNGKVNTQRIGCRELQAGAQACVFEGFTCINTSSARELDRPEVYFMMDKEEDGTRPYGDQWCGYRHQSSDPTYWSASRHWPILEGTFIPQQSCLNAFYRSQKSLFGGDMSKLNIKWVDSLWLVDLDFINNSHDNHLLMEIIWLLDAVLWQKGMDLRRRPDDFGDGAYEDTPGHLFSGGPRHLYLPQTYANFEQQTSEDINRLTYSLILQRNISRLYPNFTADEMHQPSTNDRFSVPMMDAYPDLKRDERMLFHHNLIQDESVDMVCTPRFVSGPKIGNGAHERVCRYIRQETYKLFGIEEPEMQRVGQVFYPQPPKRLIILQRHLNRRISNIDEVEKAMREAFEKYDVEIEVVSTSELITAEDRVRLFARAGVLLTSHGSQSMAQMWMPRHSSLIEIMPVAYIDYSFHLLAESCKIWYYTLFAKVTDSPVRNDGRPQEDYEEECGDKRPHLSMPCISMKSEPVTVHVDQAVNKVRYAFERMGHEIGPWLDSVNSGLWMS